MMEQENVKTDAAVSNTQHSKTNKLLKVLAYSLSVPISLVAGVLLLTVVGEALDLFRGEGGWIVFMFLYIILIPLFIFIGILITRAILIRKFTRNTKLVLLLIVVVFFGLIIIEILTSSNNDKNELVKVEKELLNLEKSCEQNEYYTLRDRSSSNRIDVYCIDEEGFPYFANKGCTKIGLTYRLSKKRPEAPGEYRYGISPKHQYKIILQCYSSGSYMEMDRY